jgi:hypothetical protein
MSRFLRAFLEAKADHQKTCFSGTPVPNIPKIPKNPLGDGERKGNATDAEGFSPFSTYSGQVFPKNAVFEEGAPALSASAHTPNPKLRDDAIPDEIETLALALLAEAEASPAQTITDQAKALVYFRSEARRRLDLIRQRAADATTGEDIEREAIMAEETAPTVSPEVHKRAVAGLMLAALPLAGVPGALACRGCGRSIWRSPSWRGSPPDLCFACARVTP